MIIPSPKEKRDVKSEVKVENFQLVLRFSNVVVLLINPFFDDFPSHIFSSITFSLSF